MSPRVSICIPTYAQVECLRRALDSVAAQDYADFEVVVADDSPDDSVARLLGQHPLGDRIRYFKNAERKGSPENWNVAIRNASGEYIKLLHHDDWLTERDSLARYVALLDEAPEVDLAFSASLVVDARDGSERSHAPSDGQIDILRSDPTVLFFANFIGSPSATIYRSASALDYDANLKWLVDVDYYIRVLRNNGRIAYSEDLLIATLDQAPHRITSECLADPGIDVVESLYLYEKIRESVPAENRAGFLSYLDERIKRAKLKSAAEIRRAGYREAIPKVLTRNLMRRRIHSALIEAPLGCLRRVAKGVLPNSVREKYRAAVIARHRRKIDRWSLEKWERDGRPLPPPDVVKQRTVVTYARDFGLRTLIETGTFRGNMVRACRDAFERIISIELDSILYEKACARFSGSDHIEIVHGDSANLLPKMIEPISDPCLFWLDGHYSAGVTAKGEMNTPIIRELSAICDHGVDGHVILIDDARCFTGEEDYPTIDEVREFVMRQKPDYEFELDCDIMCFTPRRTPENRSGSSAKR